MRNLQRTLFIRFTVVQIPNASLGQLNSEMLKIQINIPATKQETMVGRFTFLFTLAFRFFKYYEY